MSPVSSAMLLLVAGLFACAVRLPSHAQQSAVREHFTLAQQDEQNGLLDAAAEEYRAVLKLQPGLPEAYVNLGLVYYAQAKFQASAQALAAAARLKPGMHGVSLWLGIDYVKLNRPVEGAALLRQAVRLDPADKVAQSWLATSLWDARKIDSALSQLRSAGAQFPDDADLLFALSEAYDKAASEQIEQLLDESAGTALSDFIYGSIYLEERAWPKAESHLRRAIERDPTSLDARLKLVRIYIEQGQLVHAQESMDEAIKLVPHSASALAQSGELLLLMQQTGQGLSRIEEAVKLDQSEALDALGLPIEDRYSRNGVDAKLVSLCHEASTKLAADPTSSSAKGIALAALYLLAGDEDAALQSYNNIALAQAGTHASTNDFANATVALHQHRYDDAEALLLRWHKTHPADRAALYDLALARRQISRSQLRRLLLIAPNSYHVPQMLGQLYASRQEDEKAQDEYRIVAAARPDLPGVHFWLGHLYWKHGDAEHARVEFLRELELSPGHAESNGELGAILLAEGRTEEAISHLEAAIHSKPDLWPAYAQLGRAYASQKKYSRAQEVLTQALTHDHDGNTHYQLAMALRAEGKSAEAARAFAQVRAIKNENLGALSSEDTATERSKQ